MAQPVMFMMCEENNMLNRDEPKKPKRSRATIDNSSLDSSCLMRPTPKARKRLSLQPRRVQFSSMSDLKYFEHSPASVSWYTYKDQQRFKQEQKRDVMLLRESHRSRTESVPIPPNSCPVGIEQHILAPDLAETYLNRRFVIQSVVLEQKRQRHFGYCDPGRLASVAERLTADSCMNAFMRGQYQEELAKIAVLDVLDQCESKVGC
ncbi:hypothetical protein ACHAWU_009166 [Discostella pseudostelligera]|uniref:Uncharacterized protein n=1 Tax=Discostella pseudostelligera TaxID=259834 RepID=A0ABD3N7I0_9STRA